MKKSLFIVASLLFFSLAFLAALGYSDQSPVLKRLSYMMDDVLFKARYASESLPASRDKLLIIAIDDESSFRLGLRWPWPRTTFAAMLAELGRKKAAVVGLNFTFMGLEDGKEASTQSLAEAIGSVGPVVVGSTLEEGRLLKPNTMLLDAGARYGFLEKIVDDDFVIRRAYVSRQSRFGISHDISFPNALRKELGSGSEEPASAEDEKNGRPINYTVKPRDLKTVSVWKLLDGHVPLDIIQGKTVLVGITSSLLSDEHHTPLGLMSGVAVHANEWIAFEEGRPLREALPAATVFAGWAVGASLLFLFLQRRVWLTVLGFAFCFFLIFFSAQTFFAHDLHLSLYNLLLGPLLALGVGVTSNLLWLFFENQGLSHRVLHDKMTGLYTYDYLRMRLDDEWKRSVKLQLPVSVVMTDLDRFKKINDTLGHEVGNQMILKAAAVIRESVRGYDVVSRYGGDEFVILLWHANVTEAKAYRERLRAMYAKMAAALEEPSLQTSSISIGYASFDPKSESVQPKNPQELVELADKDLFEDKESRRKPGEEKR